jgi:hypothetical protein
VGYRYQAGTATMPVSGTLTVLPAVTVVSVAADPADVGPGESTVVRTVLRNRASVAAGGDLTTIAPEGWSVEPASQGYDLAPGAETTVESTLVAPLTVTEGPAPVTVATGPSDAERAATTVSVRFDNPPPGALDHVDLGDAGSEQTHGLVASAHSGTNIEAGLTRRYTNVTYPGGYFEFDLAIAPGEPFILRSIETYDQAQLKDYDVLVDGVVVHHRSFQRTAGGAGTVSYQVVIDAAHADADGTVRVRFQDSGDGYDPSIADVWSLPSPQPTGSIQDGSF